ncbi:MAG: hypothetical protein ACI9F9_001864 [Candidatus Paceibacteria bacterium]|jgi:hypothetical protein
MHQVTEPSSLFLFSGLGMAMTFTGAATAMQFQIPSVPAPVPEVFDIGVLSRGPFAMSEDFVVFRAAESAEGDLNGDGDTSDNVLHVFDISARTVTNLGIAVDQYVNSAPDFFRMNNNRVVIQVSEALYGTDANGDGDTGDEALLVYHCETGVLKNMGYAVSYTRPSFDGRWLTFVVNEQRDSRDHNSDGLLNAHVLFTYDADMDVITNRVAHVQEYQWIMGLDGHVVFSKAESLGGPPSDLNLDGDVSDWVPHLLNLETGATTNLGHASEWGGVSVVNERMAAFYVWESADGGSDYNADGDSSDLVLFVHETTTGTTTNTGLVIPFTGNDGPLWAPNGVVCGDKYLFFVHENANGPADMNGDGDTGDYVIHVFDLVTQQTTNLGLALQLGGTQQRLFSGESGDAFFLVSEVQQQADLDGNGDLGGLIAYHYDPLTGLASNTATPTGCDLWDWQQSGEDVAVRVYEIEAGADLNGDGLFMHVVMRRNSRTGGMVMVPFPGGHNIERIAISERLTFGSAFEGSVDLTGDGDTIDRAGLIYDHQKRQVFNSGVSFPSGGMMPRIRGDLAAWGVLEAEEGEDLNGNGQLDSWVHDIHLVKFP